MARILVIEEESNAAEVATVICRDDGHECATVSSLTTALNWVAGESFDLVILDFNSPKGHELEFLGALREQEATRDLPVVLLAPLDPQGRRELEQAGATRVLPKPFSIQMLQSTLRQILKRKPSRSEQQV